MTDKMKVAIFDSFSNESDDSLAMELVGFQWVLNELVALDDKFLNSFVFEYLADILDIAKDVLVAQFIHKHFPFNPEDCEKNKK